MDFYTYPDGSTIDSAEMMTVDVGGSAANICAAVASQGLRCAISTVLSDDAIGRAVLQRLKDRNVDVSGCRLVTGDYRTSLAIAEMRSTECEVVIYRNQAADLLLAPADIRSDLIARACILVVTGTSLASQSSRSAVLSALKIAKVHKTFSIFDIDHRDYSWLSREHAGEQYREVADLVDAVVGNELEFLILGGNARRPSDTAQALVQRGASFTILKQGAEGSISYLQSGIFRNGTFTVEAKKPFGAGDAFLGNVVAWLVRDAEFEQAVRFGSAAAAYVVARRGCSSAMPTRDELELFISEN